MKLLNIVKLLVGLIIAIALSLAIFAIYYTGQTGEIFVLVSLSAALAWIMGNLVMMIKRRK